MSDLQCASTLLIARHGEAEYETDRLTDAGGSLSLRGREQARELGTSLRGRRIAYVYCSPLARAVQSAEIAAGVLGVGVRVREGLQELTVGAYEGQPEDLSLFRETFEAWGAGDLSATYDGGESAERVVARVRGALESIVDLHRGETVLVVSHGGVMGLVLPRLVSNLPDAHAHGRVIPNGAVAELLADADDWRCERWPDQGDG
ncbi:histidine phosphatase family protein [Solicola gregarius]|uniref:Histidine phosphatase family protein n=1 Tax=Solicola gregarius TaxID=2908642 RepID=A0AA46TJF5_9ACTN|nr:histidine phosphatase family protein [Solicola gregarius]UYM05957.1 histidine phosphatase family protein [Solicola gregarius]